MSAQSLNASSYSGYSGSVSASNPSGAVPSRDASDITRQIRERLFYLNSNTNTLFTKGQGGLITQRPQVNPAGVNWVLGNTDWSWQPYSNQYRLSYFYGKLKGCTTCNGGLFDGNGPLLPGTTLNGTTGS